VTQGSRRWAARIGRAGYAARAAVYGLVATIALDAARRYDPREPRGVIGALRKLAERPGGRLLLAMLAAGLAAQVVWRGVQATTDIERTPGHAPRWWTRLGWSFIGLFYASLFVRAVGFVFHRPSAGGALKRSLVTRALDYAPGRALVFGIGAGLVVFAVVELWKAWRVTFMADFDERALGPRRRRFVCWLGRAGLVGRAFVFAAGGVMLARSAWRARMEVLGTGGVLRELVAVPFGQTLVAAIAVGLFAYAALMIFEAAWRRNVRL